MYRQIDIHKPIHIHILIHIDVLFSMFSNIKQMKQTWDISTDTTQCLKERKKYGSVTNAGQNKREKSLKAQIREKNPRKVFILKNKFLIPGIF